MAAMFEFRKETPLTDSELDAVLSAADSELLEYVRAAARPEAAILKIMDFADDSASPAELRGASRPGVDDCGAGRQHKGTAIGAVAACVALIALCATRPADAVIAQEHQQVHRQFKEAGMRSQERGISLTVSFRPHRYDITPAAGSRLSLILKVSKIWRESNVTISAYTNGRPGSSETVTLADERIKAVRDWLTARAAAGALHTTTLVVADRTIAQVHDGLAMVSAVPYATPGCARNATGCPP
jgi:hypothetical protein